MAFALPVIITDAGRDASIAAEALGINLVLSHMAVGDGAAIPDASWTTLENERERVEVLGGQRVGPAQLQINALLQSGAEFTISQIGIFTSTGVLFAVAWRSAGIVHKTAGVPYPIAFDLNLEGVSADHVTINATLSLDLAFVGPVAALTMAVANLTRRQIDQEIRLRALEGRPTGGMETIA